MCSGVITPCRNPLCARVECMPGYETPPVMDDFDRFLAGEGRQCRTMLSQRPCGSSQCTREECSRARVSASVLESNPVRVHAACGKAHSVYDTTCGTENGVTGSESVPQTTGGEEPTYSLTGLTRDDVDLLCSALWTLRHGDSGWIDSADDLRAERMIDKLDEL